MAKAITFGEPSTRKARCLRPLSRKRETVHSSVYNHFNQERHLCSRDNFKLNRAADAVIFPEVLILLVSLVFFTIVVGSTTCSLTTCS